MKHLLFLIMLVLCASTLTCGFGYDDAAAVKNGKK